MYGGCPLCPLYPLLTKASSHAISFKAFRWGIRVKKNSLGPRDQKRISRAEQRGLWTRQRETVLYSLSLSLKTLDTGILLWAFFTLEIEVDYPSETSRCTDAPPPHRHPFSDFFLGEGGLYTGYQKRIIHIQTIGQNWQIKSGGWFIQN